jgi:hypothetical protein
MEFALWIQMNKFNTWFKGLKTTGKVTFIASLVIVFLGVVGASAQPSTQTITQPIETNETKTTEPIIEAPIIETKTETRTESIPYTTSTINTSSLAKGKTQVQSSGIDGVKAITYTVTLTNGTETGRTSEEVITVASVNEVLLVGTYEAPEPTCDPNYSGCVPIASDVDCSGGGGNGPAYVRGPVYVTGSDIYGLDRDGNGVGCE